MTDPTPQPGADTGLPERTLRDLEIAATQLQELIGGLDALHHQASVMVALDQADCEISRRAAVSMGALIEVCFQKARALSNDLGALADSAGRAP